MHSIVIKMKIIKNIIVIPICLIFYEALNVVLVLLESINTMACNNMKYETLAIIISIIINLLIILPILTSLSKLFWSKANKLTSNIIYFSILNSVFILWKICGKLNVFINPNKYLQEVYKFESIKLYTTELILSIIIYCFILVRLYIFTKNIRKNLTTQNIL